MNDIVIELGLMAGAALVLLSGDDDTYKMALLRASLVVVLVAGAVTVWALARYWA